MTEYLQIPLADIEPDPDQPRKDFDEVALQELADSIAATGVKQAISVRPHPHAENGIRYMIIAGERRWRASGLAGKEEIPAILITDEEELTDNALYVHQLTENLHRQDLNPVEKAEFINERIEYLKNEGFSNAVQKVAEELGVSPSWISKNTAILKYEPEVRALARNGKIRDYSLLKRISGLKGEKKQAAITQIENGEFNAKEFFKRKRYDGPKKSKESQPVSLAKQPSAAESDRSVKISIDSVEWVRIIEKTDYVSIMERFDPNWREASAENLRDYIKGFRRWLNDTAETKELESVQTA